MVHHYRPPTTRQRDFSLLIFFLKRCKTLDGVDYLKYDENVEGSVPPNDAREEGGMSTPKQHRGVKRTTKKGNWVDPKMRR